VAGPVCGHSWNGETCDQRGEHLCPTRVAHVVGFFAECLVHTKGRWTNQAFVLADWQTRDIVAPLFGTVIWSPEAKRYIRRYRLAWLELARKQGKALDVSTPILADRGWVTMGDLTAGDRVHAADGSLVRVQWVSERHTRPSYAVRFADGAEIVAADDHKWTVNDRRMGISRVVTTAELAETLTYGPRDDRRYSVDVPGIVERPAVALPIDPYVLGCWLGDGTASRAEITTPDPHVVSAIEAAGYPSSYRYVRGGAVTVGFVGGLLTALRDLGVLRNKHVPAAYLTGSADQRLALLRGLMDADGCVTPGRTTPQIEFATTTRPLADAVLFLARSLGWKPAMHEGRATLYGKDCGPKYRVVWTAFADRSPFSLDRKSARLTDPPARKTRASTNSIVAIEPVGTRDVVCISVDHPSHTFLAGRSLTPTHNSELLAGIALYLLVADGEGGAEIYGCARDRDQARKVFDVAERMVKLSRVLQRRLKIYASSKRIVDEKTGSWYEIVAADTAGNLGHNPSGVIMDETITQRDSGLWTAMRTAMGARDQPLMVAATTAGDDPQSFAAQEHAECERIVDDPDRAPHVFVFMRNTPADADPWDEANWAYASPALGTFFSLQTLRDEALEAKNDPAKENSFRQFRLNQWISQGVRWMPMSLWDASCRELWLNPTWGREKLAGRECFAGFDLAAKFDLTAWCLMFPPVDDDTGPIETLWRFWLPESGLVKLDKVNDGKFTRWAKAGWLTVTPGNVIDYDQVTADIGRDAVDFAIRRADCDEWSMWPIINRVAETCRLDVDNGEIVAYRNTFERLSSGMDELFGLVQSRRLEHHGNPVARFCFDCCEVRRAAYDPNLLRPVKPERGTARTRIDAVPTAAMAANAMRGHAAGPMRVSAYEQEGLMVI
jgi:phage terminase large subunit-like protein